MNKKKQRGMTWESLRIFIEDHVKEENLEDAVQVLDFDTNKVKVLESVNENGPGGIVLEI